MRNKLLMVLLVCLGNCDVFSQSNTTLLRDFLTSWHTAAKNADFNSYFDKMHRESVFIGTDATERWTKEEFMQYAKPHFDGGRAWAFTPLEQHFSFSKDGQTVWFDELLSTQMKLCRGSGVLVKEKGRWWIKHYVLSMTIPNDLSGEVIKLKSEVEDSLIKKLKE